MSKKQKSNLEQSPTFKLDIFKAYAELQGPLPPPEAFAAYEKIAPGAAQRILEMAEREQIHRIKMETEITNSRIEDVRGERREIARSQWLAWTLALIVVGIGSALVYFGYPWPGTLISGGTIVGIISAFLRIKNKSANQSKSQTS